MIRYHVERASLEFFSIAMDLDSIVSSLEDAGLSDVLANFEFEDVESMAKNPAVMGLLVLAAQVLQLLLPPVLNLAREKIRETVGIHYVPPLLESDHNCGITTGGKVHIISVLLYNSLSQSSKCLPFHCYTFRMSAGGIVTSRHSPQSLRPIR